MANCPARQWEKRYKNPVSHFIKRQLQINTMYKSCRCYYITVHYKRFIKIYWIPATISTNIYMCL